MLWPRMLILNLYSGPGAGKSTTAAYLFAALKAKNIRTELVGEFAKELIYLGNEVQLVNQVYIMGSQYRKLKDLERHNIQVAISDSPLLLQLVYCRNKTYYQEISALIKKLNSEFDNVDVYIERCNPYQTYGRVNTEQEAIELDKLVKESMDHDFNYTIKSNSAGVDFLERELLKLLTSTPLERNISTSLSLG